MSERALEIRLRINFSAILFAVLFLHLFLLLSNGLPEFSLAKFLPEDSSPTTLKIRRVRTTKVENPLLKTSDVFLNDAKSVKGPKTPVTLKDLATATEAPSPTIPRPGTRPDIRPKKGAGPLQEMNKISLKSQQFKETSRSFPSGGLAISDMISNAQKISDAVVSIEVPEGVRPDELNEYELMFYGFQKRTAINYINSILSNLDQFQKKYPNYKIPASGKITMTARVTYDQEGNVMQIKMIRWTHVNEIQNLFEEIVKDIDQLHNPPKKLWEKENQFSMFYTLEILNG